MQLFFFTLSYQELRHAALVGQSYRRPFGFQRPHNCHICDTHTKCGAEMQIHLGTVVYLYHAVPPELSITVTKMKQAGGGRDPAYYFTFSFGHLTLISTPFLLSM